MTKKLTFNHAVNTFVGFQKNGNRKVGTSKTGLAVWTISKLPGSSAYTFVDSNGKKTIVNGSCQNCGTCWDPENPEKSPCYVPKSFAVYPDVAPCYAANSKMFHENFRNYFETLDKQLGRARGRKIIRIHASGELETAAELMEYVNLAIKYPHHIFGIYSKRMDLVKNVLDVVEKFPRNFCMNVSVWRDSNIDYGMELVEKGIAQVFAVDPAAVTDNAEFCPAYDEKGHMLGGHECNKCMKCYTNKGRFIICPEH